ncbi:MAG: hypothetical protein WEC84_04130 [Candidatus Andersenbacteria bacterium]
MYEYIKSKLQQAGEVMIKSTEGQMFELHLHNTSFDDARRMIEIDAGTEVYWINGEEIAYAWIHKEVK